jgi:hypothetical protein
MIYRPDTNACISLLRQKQPQLIARSRRIPLLRRTSDTLLSLRASRLRRAQPGSGIVQLKTGAQRGSLPVQSGARRDGNPGIYGNPGNMESATYRI